jgi:hypothetical protein
VDSERGVGVLDTYLTLESVGISKEQTEHWPEVRHEVVRGSSDHEPVANCLERIDRSCLKRKVVEATPTKHRSLTICLGVAFDLEDVELGPFTDLDDGKSRTASVRKFGAVSKNLGIEDVFVEGVQSGRVVRDHRNVVEALEQHRKLLSWWTFGQTVEATIDP